MESTYLGTYAGERGEPQPFLDPLNRRTYKIETALLDNSENVGALIHTEVRRPAPLADSDVVSSEIGDGMHAPAIDIDVPIRAVPSTSEDHWHLYIQKPMTWRAYKRLLRALVEAGIVEEGYYKASVARGGTHLRLPWVRKVAA